ncbi:hypothetical protein [Shimia abyssi]|uniref:Uncharacterized protein n=1 Tax=Shimia abyssi TaxID=1662395 RepID=A0A2P8FHW1_9RHOB|nr:hypothetical protein [Shimia abyssi]PSL21288.1 hypothetical protein CLV88_102408 [Shimia abyssi]
MPETLLNMNAVLILTCVSAGVLLDLTPSEDVACARSCGESGGRHSSATTVGRGAAIGMFGAALQRGSAALNKLVAIVFGGLAARLLLD